MTLWRTHRTAELEENRPVHNAPGAINDDRCRAGLSVEIMSRRLAVSPQSPVARGHRARLGAQRRLALRHRILVLDVQDPTE